VGNVGVDFLHQLFDGAEGTAPDGLLSDEPEPAFDLIEPADLGGRVMNVVTRMTCQPGVGRSSNQLFSVCAPFVVGFDTRLDCRHASLYRARKPTVGSKRVGSRATTP